MTENKRIALNIIATYGRSLFAIACGLFSGRWALAALGEIDYGLYGVVGGLAGFISFLNGLMADAVGRFYAFAVGESKKKGSDGVDVCIKWFNTALMIHLVVPAMLILIGYPIGIWAIKNWLTIPVERVPACIWVFRCVCIGCFVGMVNVPFTAMYRAKLYIAELTIYGFAQTLANVIFLYHIASHPGDWLIEYAAWNCVLMVVPHLLICLRACVVFPECCLRVGYLMDIERFKQLFAFAACRFGGALCGILSNQGMTLLVNKMLGPSKNAAMTVANSVSGHAQTFAGALTSALYPVVTNSAGEGDMDKMRKWAFAACKFSAFFVLIFALPLMCEIEEVMKLWLVNPPSAAPFLCWCLLIVSVLENITSGHYMAIFSVGRIKQYQFWASIAGLMVLPMSCLLIFCYEGVSGVGVALIISTLLIAGVRLHYGRTIGSMPIRYWVEKILGPFLGVSLLSYVAGRMFAFWVSPSIMRIFLVTCTVEIIFLPLSWRFAMDFSEREYLVHRLVKALHLK